MRRARRARREHFHSRAEIHVGIRPSAVAEKTFPAFPAHAQPAILRIGQEVHGTGQYATQCDIFPESQDFIYHTKGLQYLFYS